jgi:hypothetical protein
MLLDFFSGLLPGNCPKIISLGVRAKIFIAGKVKAYAFWGKKIEYVI